MSIEIKPIFFTTQEEFEATIDLLHTQIGETLKTVGKRVDWEGGIFADKYIIEGEEKYGYALKGKIVENKSR